MNRGQLAMLSIVAVTAVIAAAVFVPMTLRQRFPFEGERAIDLGTKAMHGEPAVWTGQFELRNVSGEAVHVLTLRPNCGCVHAELPRKVVPAGETLEIPFTMTLERHGKRSAYIDVLLADERVIELRLDAEAREVYRVTATPREAGVGPAESATVMLFVQVHDGENPPPAPVIEPPVGVMAEFTEWTELEGREMQGEASRRWRGEISVALASSAGEFSDGVMRVRIGEEDGVNVRIVRAGED